MQNELFDKMPVPKAYMKLAIPVMLSSVLMLVYNMVDMYFIAGTGNTNLVAGVALCAPVFTFLIAVGDIFGLGGSSVISRLFGGGKADDGRRLSVFSFIGSALTGVLIAVLLLAGTNPILKILGANAETMEFARSYYFWIALGSPVIIFSLVPTNLLRTEGLATGAMIGSFIGSIVNMVLDPVFIFGLKMGAGGAAIATVIGNICADLFYIWLVLNKSKLLSLDPRGFHISLRELKQILGIGIPSSITNIMSSIAVMLLNRFLLPYGNDKIAAMGIVSKIVMIVIMIMVAFSFGGQPLYGYLYGSGNKKRMNEVIRFAYTLVCGLGLALSAVLFAAAPLMISIFMKDAGVIATGTPMLRAILAGMPFIGYTMVTTCIFQSTGKAAGALLLSAGRQGYIYAVVIFLASLIAGYNGVICAQAVSDILAALLAFILFRKFLGRSLKEDEPLPYIPR
ncbi:MAG: MATE family efflux transporter [Solobacterium sp.]|nr:MATE family efflux transporter [Solobacterium sp.]